MRPRDAAGDARRAPLARQGREQRRQPAAARRHIAKQRADLEARLRGADGNSTTNNTTTSDGGVAYGGYGNAFRYVFTNLFDFCIQDGLYRLVPLLGDVETTLAHYNFLRDGGDTLDAWLDNAVNTLLWPLPQTNADFTCSCSRRGDGGWENCEARTHAR